MKTCSICQQEKNESEFSFRNSHNNILHKHCKDCQKIMRKRSYEINKKYYLNYQKSKTPEWRKKKKEFIIDYKTDKPCADCGEFYPHYVMDFDHLPEFKKRISIAKRGHTYSKKVLLEEFAKCELVCSNCHRERTWQRKNAEKSKSPN